MRLNVGGKCATEYEANVRLNVMVNVRLNMRLNVKMAMRMNRVLNV